MPPIAALLVPCADARPALTGGLATWREAETWGRALANIRLLDRGGGDLRLGLAVATGCCRNLGCATVLLGWGTLVVGCLCRNTDCGLAVGIVRRVGSLGATGDLKRVAVFLKFLGWLPGRKWPGMCGGRTLDLLVVNLFLAEGLTANLSLCRGLRVRNGEGNRRVGIGAKLCGNVGLWGGVGLRKLLKLGNLGKSGKWLKRMFVLRAWCSIVDGRLELSGIRSIRELTIIEWPKAKTYLQKYCWSKFRHL